MSAMADYAKLSVRPNTRQTHLVPRRPTSANFPGLTGPPDQRNRLPPHDSYTPTERWIPAARHDSRRWRHGAPRIAKSPIGRFDRNR